MPKKPTHDPKSPLAILKTAGQVLVAIGTPPLFTVKLILSAAIWLGNLTLKFFPPLLTTLKNLVLTTIPRIKSFRLSLPKILRLTSRRLRLTSRRTPKLTKIRRLPTISQIRLKLPAFRSNLTLPHPHHPHLPLHLTLKPQLRRDILLLTISFLIFFLLFLIPFSAYTILSDLPNPQLLTARQIPLSTKIYDRNGILLYQFYADQNRTLVNLDNLPPYIAQATVAIEDKNFYHHQGIDMTGIARAAWADASGNEIQGGSTITQQLVKLALLTPERTILRKIKEIILAYWAEKTYSKKQILTMYLNYVPYGGSAYGIEAASETYFGKHARQLTLSEASLLAGLPTSPTTFSPFGSHPELAKTRQEQVLKAMVEQGYVTQFAADNAAKEQLHFNSTATEIKAPHFVMYIKDYLAQKYGLNVVEQGGLQVITSLDYSLYEKTLQILKSGVAAQKNLHVGNGAVLITNPKTGEILTMIGSTDFFDLAHDGNVNVTTAQRSPGSSIKPLNYALAFEKGWLTPWTILEDTPTTYNLPGLPPYSPVDYDGRFHGRVTARVALGSSYNVPAVKVLSKNGLNDFIDFTQKMGITTFTNRSRFGLSLTLGGGEVKMTDMAEAFGTFANSGVRTDLTPILQVKDYQGQLLEDSTSHFPLATSRFPIISPKTAFLINDILADDSARTPTFGPGSPLNIAGHTVSVKTGTTQDKRDNWTIGYSFGNNPYLVAVWVGNNDYSPMSPYLESGNTGAAAIWNPIIKDLLKDQSNSPIPKPDNLIPVQICTITGSLPCDGCPFVHTEYFQKGSEPKNTCSLKKEDWEKLLKSPQTNNSPTANSQILASAITPTPTPPTPTPSPRRTHKKH